MSEKKNSLHPAPVPEPPIYPGIDRKSLPPKLHLRGCSCKAGIYLTWDVTQPPTPTNIDVFELFYYKEDDKPPHPSIWMSLVDVHRVTFPGSFEAQGLAPNAKYHFIVRARDSSGRCGPCSEPFTAVWKKP